MLDTAPAPHRKDTPLHPGGQARRTTLLDARLDEGIRVDLMTIDAALAKKWLKRNRLNRPIRRARVQHLARALKEGAYSHANGETLIFSSDHDLMDGQHRLTAVVETGIPITSLVVFGVEPHKRGSIDTGAKRELGDYFGMLGEKNARNLAGAATALYHWERGTFLSYKQGHAFVSFDEAQAFLAAHPGFQDSVATAKRIKKLLRLSHSAMLHWLFTQKDPELATVWVDTLADGHERPGGAVFITLRERLLRELTVSARISNAEKAVYAIKAWNSARSGRHIKVFKWHETEPVPEII